VAFLSILVKVVTIFPQICWLPIITRKLQAARSTLTSLAIGQRKVKRVDKQVKKQPLKPSKKELETGLEII
jgi:hypothetical protein